MGKIAADFLELCSTPPPALPKSLKVVCSHCGEEVQLSPRYYIDAKGLLDSCGPLDGWFLCKDNPLCPKCTAKIMVPLVEYFKEQFPDACKLAVAGKEYPLFERAVRPDFLRIMCSIDLFNHEDLDFFGIKVRDIYQYLNKKKDVEISISVEF
jgi:hypothetical protein